MAEISGNVLAALVILLVLVSAIGTYVLLAVPTAPVSPVLSTAAGTVTLYVPPQPSYSHGTVSVIVVPK